MPYWYYLNYQSGLIPSVKGLTLKTLVFKSFNDMVGQANKLFTLHTLC